MRVPVLLMAIALAGCGILPNRGPQITPNLDAIISETQASGGTVVVYDTALMSKAEAEVYVIGQCEDQGLTIDLWRHPPPSDVGATSTITYDCRRAFS